MKNIIGNGHKNHISKAFQNSKCNNFFIESFRGGKLLNKYQYPKLLLPTIVMLGYLGALPQDITLLGAQHLDNVGLVDMVIVGWPCQNHF
jgi:hypothetical protein